jgi:hypothetical protein
LISIKRNWSNSDVAKVGKKKVMSS